MADKYQNKYRISSTRLQNWDYGWNALYFITICTKNREHYFGEIISNNMILSNIGVLADVFWHEIKNHNQFVDLDAFVIMPNHIHGILAINKPENYFNNSPHNLNYDKDGGNDTLDTKHALYQEFQKQSTHLQSSNPKKTIGEKRFQNQGKNTLSSILGSYKSAVSKHAHRLGFEFEWQSRFHDHIIRDGLSFHRIQKYIETNVINWDSDKFSDLKK